MAEGRMSQVMSQASGFHHIGINNLWGEIAVPQDQLFRESSADLGYLQGMCQAIVKYITAARSNDLSHFG
jgi:hypothetical protein